MSVVTVIRRAFAVNPQIVPVSPSEQATLQLQGIQQSVIQNYFAWRRSVMVFVVVSALLGAGLSTYRKVIETGSHFDVIETIAAHSPLAKFSLTSMPIPAQIHVGDEDAADPAASHEDAPKIEIKLGDDVPETVFGQFTDIVQLIAWYAVPVAALAVIALWTRFQFTFYIMVAAFAFAFLTPLLIALCPWSWWGYVEPEYSPQAQPLQYVGMMGEGLLEGAAYLVTLLPTVLSLVPGVQRACIRVKMLLPQSILPGWFLIVASPFYALFLLVVFVAINQFDTQPLFFCGMLLFIIAPLAYTICSEVFIKPITSVEDGRRIRGVQQVVGMMTTIAGLLMLTSLASREFMGVHLLGWTYKTSLVIPFDIVEFLLETISRSMFVTVLGADLFVKMNLAAWKNAQTSAGSPGVAEYDAIMTELEQTA